MQPFCPFAVRERTRANKPGLLWYVCILIAEYMLSARVNSQTLRLPANSANNRDHHLSCECLESPQCSGHRCLCDTPGDALWWRYAHRMLKDSSGTCQTALQQPLWSMHSLSPEAAVWSRIATSWSLSVYRTGWMSWIQESRFHSFSHRAGGVYVKRLSKGYWCAVLNCKITSTELHSYPNEGIWGFIVVLYLENGESNHLCITISCNHG